MVAGHSIHPLAAFCGFLLWPYHCFPRYQMSLPQYSEASK